MFRGAASHEKLPASVYQQLKTVSALRLGRTSAPEPEPVRPVALQHVEGVRPFLSRPVNALIRLQLLTGARADELNQLLAPPVNEGLCDPDLVPAPPDEATSQPGDLWVLGNHRLLVGDSARPEDVDRLLDGAVIHLANTDPPYNVRVEPRSNNAIAAGNSSFPAPGGGGGGG